MDTASRSNLWYFDLNFFAVPDLASKQVWFVSEGRREVKGKISRARLVDLCPCRALLQIQSEERIIFYYFLLNKDSKSAANQLVD
uniref:Uncharacterized protein n=1 Tax=Anguilla anguilla TaxID=7936 RepID=A0A0E9QI79_ANGAN